MNDDGAPFNPLDKRNLGASVADAMLGRPTFPLGEIPFFNGAGVYAIYYTGDFAPYSTLSALNRNGAFALPIYIGKAIPPGARKGGGTHLEDKPNQALCKRLREHAESIDAVKNLRIEDFHCRFLVVDDIWIPLGESLLIARFAPIWNTLVDGFGNHDPGSGRHQGLRPRWDTLHPGRTWAGKCKPRSEGPDLITADIEQYLANYSKNG